MGVAETGWIWSYVRRTTTLTGSLAAAGPLWHPPADVYSTGDSWCITLALPGVRPSCVHCEVQDGTLRVRATREPPWRKGAQALRSLEIPYGRFERCFALPDPRSQVVATEFIDGCLHIQLAVPSVLTSRTR